MLNAREENKTMGKRAGEGEGQLLLTVNSETRWQLHAKLPEVSFD